MKIYQKCPVCGSDQESYHEWDSLEEFFAADIEDPEFEHDEGNRDCGGSLEYYNILPRGLKVTP